VTNEFIVYSTKIFAKYQFYIVVVTIIVNANAVLIRYFVLVNAIPHQNTRLLGGIRPMHKYVLSGDNQVSIKTPNKKYILPFTQHWIEKTERHNSFISQVFQKNYALH